MLSVKTKVAFVTTGVFIGILMTAQFQSSVPESSYLYDQLTLQKALLKSFSDDQAFLKSKILTLRQAIQQNQENLKSITASGNLDTLKKLKSSVGLEMAQGPGVEIILTDGPFANRDNPETIDQSLIHAADLRDIVNLLRSTRADAIAINDQRIIASTPISSVGNTILVNNFHTLPPFSITAVGDPDLIISRLKDPKALPDLRQRAQDSKIGFSFKTMANVFAPVYNGNLVFSYLKSSSSITSP